jgi:hypothetical protein
MEHLKLARTYLAIYKESGLKMYKCMAVKQIKLARKSKLRIVA